MRRVTNIYEFTELPLVPPSPAMEDSRAQIPVTPPHTLSFLSFRIMWWLFAMFFYGNRRISILKGDTKEFGGSMSTNKVFKMIMV